MKLTQEQIEKLEAFLTRVPAVGTKAAFFEIGMSQSEGYGAIRALRLLLDISKLRRWSARTPPRRLKANEIREYLAMKAQPQQAQPQQAGPPT